MGGEIKNYEKKKALKKKKKELQRKRRKRKRKKSIARKEIPILKRPTRPKIRIREMSEAREVKEDNEQQEGGEIREVRLREPSVSPIESDQSESYEKAGTLEGLNPETISPEEDFTSISEEEEGEIKNYEKKKALKKKKKE